MKKWRQMLTGGLLLAAAFGVLAGCAPKEAEKPQVRLTVKLPPLTVANADTEITDAYDLLAQAGEEFAAQYTDADVTVDVIKFAYTEEDDYITGCFDRPAAHGKYISLI